MDVEGLTPSHCRSFRVVSGSPRGLDVHRGGHPTLSYGGSSRVGQDRLGLDSSGQALPKVATLATPMAARSGE